MPTHPPHGNHQAADAQAGQQAIERPKVFVSQGPKQQGCSHDIAQAWHTQDVEVCARGHADKHRVDRAHTQHRGDAFERGKGADAHDHHHHQRFEVAPAHAYQGFVTAARRDDHAVAKHEPAHQGGEPHQPITRVQGFAGVKPAKVAQRGKAYHGNAHGARPLTGTGPVAEVDDIRDRAHGAKVRALADETQQESTNKKGPKDLFGERG